MASKRFYVLSSIAVMSVAAVLGGCAGQSKDSAYPPANTPPAPPQSSSSYQSSSAVTPSQTYSNPSASASMSTSTPQQPNNLATPPDGGKIRVPAGARMVSGGPYPPPSFDVSEGGSLYIWDDDDKKVALVTSVGSSDTNRNINIADMPNVANALNNKHQYRVYYVPSSAATTLPAPLGQ